MEIQMKSQSEENNTNDKNSLEYTIKKILSLDFCLQSKKNFLLDQYNQNLKNNDIINNSNHEYTSNGNNKANTKTYPLEKDTLCKTDVEIWDGDLNTFPHISDGRFIIFKVEINKPNSVFITKKKKEIYLTDIKEQVSSNYSF